MIFGNKIEKMKRWRPERSVIAEPETAPIGNIILRVGREDSAETTTWHQTEHVVLQPDEAIELANTLIDLATGKIPQVRREKFGKAKGFTIPTEQPLDSIES